MSRSSPSRVGPGGAGPWALAIPLSLLAGIVLCVHGETLRMGFFADDFHFLDVARRQPLGEVLLGGHGIWPWYRPLSRELYFYLLVLSGPAGPVLAHVLNLCCLVAASGVTYRLGEQLSGRAAGAAAAAIFAVGALARFLVSWASGFQDLLATTLVLSAVLAFSRGRMGWATVLAGLAPFAKETGFLAIPILFAWSVLLRGTRRWEPWMPRLLGVGLAAAAVHGLVRTTWPAVAHPHVAARVPGDFASVLAQGAASFLVPGPPASTIAGWAGVLAALAAALLFRSRAASDAARPAARATLAFLAIAAALSLIPLLMSAASRIAPPRAHFAFGAIPWLALLAAAALPGRAARWLVPALVLVNAWGLGDRRPSLDSREGWELRPLGWPESARIADRTDRLAADLRTGLAARAESTVVLFASIPSGSWIQSGDGPAVREILRDPTVRAFFIDEAPLDLDPGRLAIMAYDPRETHRLLPIPRDCGPSVRRALRALVERRPREAAAWAAYCPDSLAGPFPAYLRAVAALLERGPNAFLDGLHRGGLADTTGPEAAFEQPWLPAGETLARAYRPVFRAPRSAAAHAACADELLSAGLGLFAESELRAMLALRPGDSADHLKLGRLLAAHDVAAAREELVRAREIGNPAESARSAAQLLAELEAAAGQR